MQLLGSGTILREVIAGAELLETDFGVATDVWSVTSFTELRRDGLEVERWNRLHPTGGSGAATWGRCSPAARARTIAATDYMRTFADQIRAVRPGRYVVLGHRRVRPQRLPRRSCGSSSRSTATTSRSRR